MDHRRRAERDRPRRPEDAARPALPAARIVRLRQPQHGRLRPARHPLVHGAERDLRAARPARRKGAGLPGAEGRGPVRDHHDAVGRRLLRVPRGSYLGRVDTSRARPCASLQPPTRDQGARRAWSDSKGRIWVSEWNAGKVAVYAPATGRWREWRLPGARRCRTRSTSTRRTAVWLSDFGANALVRFDPKTGEVHAPPAPELPRERQAAPRPAAARCGAPSRASTSSSSSGHGE